MTRDVGVAENGGAVVQELARGALLERLALAVGLLCVADVRQRQIGSAAGEQLPERQCVAVVVGVVVGDDDPRGHFKLLPL